MPTQTKERTSPSSTSSPNGAQSELERFERFCLGFLTVNEGGPFVLEDFQKQMLADYFRGIRSTLIVIPKKNGKTTLLAALALYHLITTPDALCVIAAASREQAKTMLDQARGFWNRCPELKERIEVNQRVFNYPKLRGEIRILASKYETVDGVIPTLALIDELDHHRSQDVYGVLRDGLGPRNGQLAAISTAGDDHESPLGVVRQRAYALPGMERDGAHRHVKTDDFAYHEWALEDEDDLDDLKLVKTANPASWQSLEELRRRYDDPTMMPWQWARFAAGVWRSGEDAAISEKDWRECANGKDIPPGTQAVHIGVDLAPKWDTTAFVPVAKLGDEVQVGKPIILTPPQDGTVLPYDKVFAAAKQMHDRYPNSTFVFDPSRGGEQLAEQIDGMLEGARIAVHSQDPRFMCLAAERLTAGIGEKTLQHCDDRELNAHVLSAAAYFVGERWKFVKQKKKKLPIDGVIALAMAYSTLVGEEARDRRLIVYT